MKGNKKGLDGMKWYSYSKRNKKGDWRKYNGIFKVME